MGGKIGDISNLKKGKRITVGSLSDLVIVRKIGEGGSAFVYTARTSSVLAPAPFSDSASVAGYSAAGSVSAHVHPDDDDGASVMSYAPGDASSLAPGRRRSRRSRLFSANRGFRHLSSSSLSSDLVVIKATSTSGSSTRKRQAEKEIEVLLRLRDKHHPNMVKIYDWASVKCSTTPNGSITLCAMEYCSGGSLMDLISDRRERLLAKRARRQGGDSPGLSTERDEASATNGNGNKFLRKLILGEEIPPPPPPPTPPPLLQSIAAAGNVGNAPTANQMSCEAYFDYEDILSIFQQVASALRFLHNSFDTQPLVHRDVKPENILLIPTNVNQRETIIRGMHRWTVRLCDYGSVVEGNVPLQSPADRKAAEDVIQKSTTQMYRAPEMVDVHSVQELTAKTDIWALGCSLYMTCYLQNCFEENSSLAILSGNYLQPPDDHPYSHTSLHELIDRMLTVTASRRADADELCLCFDRLLAGKGLPNRTSGRKPKQPVSASTPLSKKTKGRGPVASRRDSPPPPPPPPRATKQKAEKQTQKQMANIPNSIPSSVVVERRPKKHARAPLHEEDLFDCDRLMGEKILMQPVPEDAAMRSNRDPRKNYGRSRKKTTPHSPTVLSVDHIYNDLLNNQVQTKRSRKKVGKEKRTTTKTTDMIDGSLSLEDELDRIMIFTTTDEIEVKATGGSEASSFGSTPPLTPIEVSSIASLSSEDQYSFSRESPMRRKKGKDSPRTRPLPTSYSHN